MPAVRLSCPDAHHLIAATPKPSAAGFGIEAGWFIAAPDDTPTQIGLSHGEHPSIFVERGHVGGTGRPDLRQDCEFAITVDKLCGNLEL